MADLFDALDGFVIHYAGVAEGERSARWSADADRITGKSPAICMAPGTGSRSQTRA
ncbi:hypothetical protein [Pseudonocardia sp.]|jgi:hypothetical protein|uniref:hypothetical protein n=1 Tax=Pseudonocardia sp. TaxID=60912 RepID=UPI0031FCF161